ncbi:hypothetical protein E2C01_101948 [Portunus trituberculatus]|uniref:Uncharacterized protein n=1 Tax=Portunus trituberculatus TaxID=210409 RepID=A0A5B7KHA0_PORTR|nr:hypothetical protein [Portunus trituberculatus]
MVRAADSEGSQW